MKRKEERRSGGGATGCGQSSSQSWTETPRHPHRKKRTLPFPPAPPTTNLCIADSSKEPFNLGTHVMEKRGRRLQNPSVNEFRAQVSFFQGTPPPLLGTPLTNHESGTRVSCVALLQLPLHTGSRPLGCWATEAEDRKSSHDRFPKGALGSSGPGCAESL